jgi:NAD(P)-dependent dehydrogenase (short-subunit alcohol dehydrogenase family)
MHDKKVLVSGGFGILGRAVGEALREAGAQVALVDFAPTPDLPEGLVGLGGIDLADAKGAEGAAARAGEALGGLDGLVNCAGGFSWITNEEATADDWRRLFDLNLSTAANLSKAALPALKVSGRGAIVNIAAKGALTAAAGMGPYAASKAGVLKLTESLAEELKDQGVRVNAVLPSILDTPQNRADMPKADPTRWVAPSDLAAVIVFLLSDAARAVTGAQVVVSGRT